MKPRVLLAMRPHGVGAVTRAIGEYAGLEHAATYDEAVARLRAGPEIDLVILGIYFDETRMFDLLRFVRSEHRETPVVCARLGLSEVPPITLEGMAIAATSMGAAAFLNLPVIGGTDAAHAEFRSAVLRHVRHR